MSEAQTDTAAGLPSSLNALALRAVRTFRERFGHDPKWLVRAPGRVNLIGEHVDYNDGFVLPMAIERQVILAAGPNPEAHARLWSSTVQEDVLIPLNEPIRPGERPWANYVRGVLAGFKQRGAELRGFDAVIDADLPLGGGLSSSAALEVATATLTELISGHRIADLEKALLCQAAERDFAGMPCGIMDQFSSVFGRAGHFLLLDCRSQKAEWVPLKDPSVVVLVINTNVKHELVDGGYAARRAQCEAAAQALRLPSLRDATDELLRNARGALDPAVYRRARHVISEIKRTTDTAAAVVREDWETVGRLMYASHVSLRDDFEVSCPELDLVVDVARSIGNEGGMIGCRMTGGGFGGCAVSLARSDRLDEICRTIRTRYVAGAGREPGLFATRPANGAEVLNVPS